MSIPGFTGEASFYGISRPSQMKRSPGHADLVAMLVQPAAAIYVGGRFVCNGEVTENGFIDCSSPGGHSEPPDLVCGPCIRGRQRCGIPGVGFSWGPCID